IKAMPDGFEMEFTRPVDDSSAGDPDSYSINSFIYKYHPVYGSPQVGLQRHSVRAIKVSKDKLKVRIAIDGARQYYIHSIDAGGVRSEGEGHALLHPTAYYTLNNIPTGSKLSVSTALIKEAVKQESSP